MKTRQSGFTLWELLMTLLVAGILFGIGVPNVMEFQRNGAMTAVANDFVTGMLMARTEAVKRQSPVTFCLSADPDATPPTCSPNSVGDSTRGFIVWADENNDFNADGSRDLADPTDGNAAVDGGETVLMRGALLTGSLRVSTDCGYVSYAPTGFPRGAPALCFPNAWRFSVCDDRGRRAAAGGLSAARAIRVDRTGRGQVFQEVADVNTAIAEIAAAGVTVTCP